ncbi:ABC transporter ATP-binding protein [Falsiroseomonas sp.]|uniref:ABC transporter ATP-binding protein n=1 Tax=Falsiroseomonas sp. TaxID=2870721 RepID=UPI003F703264
MRIALRGLRLDYPGPGGPLRAVEGLDLEVAAGEFLGLIGPSGCGKSSVLAMLAGLRAPSAGHIDFPDWTGRRPPRRLMAFQDHGLLPWLSLLDNVAFGLEAQGVPRAEREARAHAMLRRLGLEGFAAARPDQLSGGMRQRAALARLFVAEAEAMLLDEPFCALDAQTRVLLQQELLDLWSGTGRSVVYVTHDIEEALLLCDRVVVLSARPSRVVAEITVPFARPRRILGPPPPEVTALRWRIWDLLAPAIATHAA